jgi:hypothetical protein
MAKEKETCDCDKEYMMRKKWHRHGRNNGAVGGFYGLGFIGAAIYFMQQATTFWAGVLAILKGIVWPAYLIYHLFTMWTIK